MEEVRVLKDWPSKRSSIMPGRLQGLRWLLSLFLAMQCVVELILDLLRLIVLHASTGDCIYGRQPGKGDEPAR